MEIGGGSHFVFMIIALPSRPCRYLRGLGVESPARAFAKAIDAGLRTKEVRISQPSSIAIFSERKVGEFWDDLLIKWCNGRCRVKYVYKIQFLCDINHTI